MYKCLSSTPVSGQFFEGTGKYARGRGSLIFAPLAQRFVTLFRNGRTAANYIGYVAFVCVLLGLSLAWKSDALRMILKGARKRDLRAAGGKLVI